MSMLWRCRVLPLLRAFCCGAMFSLLIPAGSASTAQELPLEPAQWLAKLQKLDSHTETMTSALESVINKFVVSDSRLVYETLRTGWSTIHDRDIRLCLIHCIGDDEYVVRKVDGKSVPDDTGKINPYLLDLLEVELTDPDSGIREEVQRRLFQISAHTFKDTGELRAWRSTYGSKSVEAMAQETMQQLLRNISDEHNTNLPEQLDALGRIGFEPQYDVFVVGHPDSVIITVKNTSVLTAMHKKFAGDAGMLSTLLRLLKPDHPETTRAAVLKLLPELNLNDDQFSSFEPWIQRSLYLWFNSRRSGFDLTYMMSKHPRAWYTEALLQQLQTATETTPFSMFSVIRALGETATPSAIPALIALYDYIPVSSKEKAACDEALRKLTGTSQPYGDLRARRKSAAFWWQEWWSKNRRRFPEPVRTMRVPVLSLQWHPDQIDPDGAHLAVHLLDGDPERAYVLLGPSPLSPAPAQALPRVKPGHVQGINAEVTQSGLPLLVVLSDEDVRLERVQALWLAVIETELKHPFAVALVMPPLTADSGPESWTTEQNRIRKPNSRWITEQLVSDVVEEVCRDSGTDRTSVYLIAENDAGAAGFCCALSPATPFQGFLFLDAAFHSAHLPPLKRAAKRRLCLLLSREGGKPLLFTQAAAKVLQNAGANVRNFQEAGSEKSAGVHGKPELLSTGLRWLMHPEK